MESPGSDRNMTLSDPVDLTHYLSATARRRKANAYKLFYSYYSIPDLQDISGGLPNSSLFPVQQLSGKAPNPAHLSNDTSVKSLELSTQQEDLDVGLQYLQVQGVPELDQWIKDVSAATLPPCLYNGGYSTLQTMGNTDGLVKVLSVLSNEWKEEDPIENRQSLLCEQFTFSIATETVRVRGLNVVGLPMDKYGIIPSEMEAVLANWDPKQGKIPHILYTISIGQNPTGITVPPARRREIYDICCKYDIVLVEDEPYWFLQYTEEKHKCYLSIDTEGRVLRLDSFSKSFAPGCRMGWVTGQPELVRRIYYLAEEATQAPSGFSQLMVWKTLKSWGIEGWIQWLETLRTEYKERRDLMLEGFAPYACLEDGTRILEYEAPNGGMFLWMKVRFDLHPMVGKFSNLEFSRAFWIWNTMDPNPALINPGYMLSSSNDPEKTAEYFRCSYAPSEKGEIFPAAKSVGQSFHTFWKLGEAEIRKYAAEFPVH